MTPHWLKLRWPVTALALGGMALAGLVRLSQHPIQVKGELNMPRAVQIQPTRSLTVKVAESKPIQVDMDPHAPVKVKVGL